MRSISLKFCPSSKVNSMSDLQEQKNPDGCADVFATIAVIAIVVSAVVFWLSSMPK